MEQNKEAVVILPISATEQHGAHLPLATDRMIGEHFSKQLDKELSNEILILPSISVGCSEHHMEFAGSLSIEHNTMLDQLKNIVDSVQMHGFKKLLILNSHGGNQAIAQSFLEIYGYRNPDCIIVLATWWKAALQELMLLNETGQGGTGHAGEFETSLMLHIAPHLVYLDEIDTKANRATFSWAEGDMISSPQVSLYRSMKEMTATGVYGDARLISEKKGQKISEIVVRKLKQVILDLYTTSNK